MSAEIVRKLLEMKKPIKFLEADDEDEVEDEVFPEEETDIDDIPAEDSESIDDSPAEEGEDDVFPHRSPSYTPKASKEDIPEEEPSSSPPTEEESKSTPKDEYANPLDNKYAVHHTIGDDVVLVYADGSNSELSGVVDGYDIEGFYRVKWSNGMTTNGITDIALADLIKKTTENKCVCGHTQFVTEGAYVVCDRCGRRINESSTISDDSNLNNLIRNAIKGNSKAIAELKRLGYIVTKLVNPLHSIEVGTYEITNPKNKKSLNYMNVIGHYGDTIIDNPAAYIRESMTLPVIDKDIKTKKRSPIRAIPHPISTATRPNIPLGEDLDTEEEEYEEDEFEPFRPLIDNLKGEFWTRASELQSDIEELGYIVYSCDSESVEVGISDDDDFDDVLVIPVGGTARTITLDFNRMKLV